MMETYEAFAAGKLTAQSDLIRALTDVLRSNQPDAEKVRTARILLAEAAAGAQARRREFDVEV